MAKIPARYVGELERVLPKFGGPYTDGEGRRLTSLLLNQGDTLMVEAEEVYGATWLHDPRHELDSQRLGVGRVVRESDNGLSDEELMAKGYEFHQPSGWWEPYTPESEQQKKKAANSQPAKKESEK